MKTKLLFLLFPILVFSQGYTSYFTGNSTNITTNPEFGVCLMGGATEHDNAMKWLLQKANGGDVVVLRSSGSNGYNDYLYSELGIPVNSVETLVITSVAGATNPYVLNKVANAEMIWFAGGDQYNYVSYFKNNALEDLINNHINVKHAPIGGTSAGMAILGEHYFSAQNGSVTSSQALSNPYNSLVAIGSSDFVNIPVLKNVITDTHFDNPDRKGRLMTFLARLNNSTGHNNYGIASNEYVAVCIDGQGNTQVFGDYPNYQEFAYFVVPNCLALNNPEVMQANTNLTWNFNSEAVYTYKVAGLPNGSQSFTLENLFLEANGQGGEWKKWTVNNGIFTETSTSSGYSCLLANQSFTENKFQVQPNPFSDLIRFENDSKVNFELIDIFGRIVLNENNYTNNSIETGGLSSGIYLLKLEKEGQIFTQKLIKN